MSQLGAIDFGYSRDAAELDAVAHIPVCSSCVFYNLYREKHGHLWWKVDIKEARCSLRRFDPVHGGLIGNGSAQEMRAIGRCGPDGKLFQSRDTMRPILPTRAAAANHL